MNHIYRTLWSVSTQSWQAVPENARTGGKKSSSSAAGVVASVALGFALSGAAHAQSPLAVPPAINQLPTGGSVARGTATFSQTATAQAAAMTVTQSSQRAVINWSSFNLGSAASVNFVQPNAQAVTLNRVNDSSPSQIFGRITANGQVFLTNANGVYFSPTSSVDVGAFTATTHTISDDNFMSGKYVFERNGSTGKVVNEGNINAALGGYVALLAPEVQNAGVVVARAGTVAMAAGELITLNVDNNGSLAGITTTPSTIASLIENKLAVQAPDGQIILSAVGLSKLQTGVIKNSGSLEANSINNKGGKVYLEGDDITLSSTSKIEAKGPAGGGTVLVGGDWQGSGDLRQATKVTMEAGASIDASATDNGDGGKVVLWSDIHNADSVTRAKGNIKAEAGPNGGDGGKVETSGHHLNVDGIQVSTSSQNSGTGEWLLDPIDFTIAPSGGDMTGTALGNLLASNNITIYTVTGTNNATTYYGSVGGTAGNVNINDNISWNTSKTLAFITYNGGITGSGNISGGGTVTANQNGSTTYSGSISGNGGFTKAGGGTLTLDSAQSYTGTTTIAGGALQLNSTFSGNGAINISASTAKLILNNDALTIGGNIASSTAGYGSLVVLKNAVLSGANSSYSGATTLTSGTLTLGSANAIGSSGTISFGGGTLQYSASNTSDYSSRFSTAAGQAYSLDTNGQSVTLGSNLTSLGGTLTKLGSGTLTLTGTNSYGATTISAGTLQIGVGSTSGTLGTGAVTDNGTLIINRSDAYSLSGIASDTNGITGTGNLKIQSTGGALTIDRNISLTGASSRIDLYSYTNAGSYSASGDLTFGLGNTISTSPTGTIVIFSGTANTAALIPLMSGATGSTKYKTYNVIGTTALSGAVIGTINFYYRQNPGSQTVTGLTITATKVYDKTTSATGATFTQTGGSVATGIDGDSFIATASGGTFNNSGNVGATLLSATFSAISANSGWSLAGYSSINCSSCTYSGTITPKALTVTGTTVISKTYDATNSASFSPLTSAALVGVLSGDAANLTLSQAGTYTQTGIGSAIPMTMHDSLSGSAASNYSLTQPSGVVGAITPKAVTVSGLLAPASRVYDGTLVASVTGSPTLAQENIGAGSASDGKIYTGDSVTFSGTATGTYNSKDVATANLVTFSGLTSSNSNYTLSLGTQAASISAKTLTMDGLSVASSKVYDGTRSATVSGTAALLAAGTAGSGTTSDGKPYLGDAVSISGTATGTYDSKDVATASSVTFTGLSLTGGQAGNYTLTIQSPAGATITPKALTVTASNDSKTYNGLAYTGGHGVAYAGFENSETSSVLSGSVSYSGSSQNAINAGSYAITPSGLTSSNYAITFADGTLTVNKASATVTANSATTTYTGLAQSASGFTASGLVHGETEAVLTGVTAGVTRTNAGTYASTASGTDSNYNLSFVNGSLTINKANLTKVMASKTYDGLSTVSATQVTAIEGVNGETFTASAGTASINDKNVLTANKTLTDLSGLTLVGNSNAALSANYNLGSNLPVSGANNQVTIDAKALGLSIPGATRVYDSTTVISPSGPVTLSGIVGSDIVNLGTGNVTGFVDKNVGTNKTVTYTGLALSGNDAGNYALPVNPTSNANITPAALSISGITAADKIYDASATATVSTAHVVKTGLIGSDVVNVAATGSFTDKNVGTGKTVNLSSSYSGADAGNYTVTDQATTTASITPAPLTVTALDALKNFGSANPAFSATVSGYVGGETAATSGVTGVGSATSTATALTDAGAAVITAGVGSLSATNYAFTRFVDGTLTIRPISVMNNAEVSTLIGAQLANLTSAQVGSFSTTQLQVFSPQQLSALSPSQLAGLTNTQLLSLSPDQIAAISPARIASMTPEQLAGLSVSQIAGLTTSQLQALSASQLSSLSDAQLQALSATQVSAIAADQLGQLTSAQIALLSSNAAASLSFQQIAALSPAQIVGVNPVEIASFTAAQIGALSNAQLQALSLLQVAAISPANLSSLTPQQIAGLTSNAAASLNFQQIAALSPAQIVGVNPVEIASFTAAQIGALSNAQLQALSLLQVAAISPANLSSLTPQQIAGLTSNAAASLNFQQIAALTPAQIVGVDSARVASLTAAEIGSLSDAQLQALSVLQIAAIAPDHFSALSPAQIMALSIAQVINLTPDQLRGLSPAQVASLSAAELAYFDARQLAAIGIVPKTEVPPAIATSNQLPLNFETPNAPVEQVAASATSTANTADTASTASDADANDARNKFQAAIPVMTAVAGANAPASVPAAAPTSITATATTVALATTLATATAQQPAATTAQAAPAAGTAQASPSVTLTAAAPQTGVLAITILSNAEPRPTTVGVAFEQDGNAVTLRTASAPPTPPASDKFTFNDKLTSFMVSSDSGGLVEFKASLVNRRLVILAQSSAARQIARTEMNVVLAAAITSLEAESRVMLANLDGVVLDLR